MENDKNIRKQIATDLQNINEQLAAQFAEYFKKINLKLNILLSLCVIPVFIGIIAILLKPVIN